jgi:hypothetical protein
MLIKIGEVLFYLLAGYLMASLVFAVQHIAEELRRIAGVLEFEAITKRYPYASTSGHGSSGSSIHN